MLVCALDVIDGGHFEGDVVHARSLALMQGEHVMVGSVGAEEHLPAVLVEQADCYPGRGRGPQREVGSLAVPRGAQREWGSRPGAFHPRHCSGLLGFSVGAWPELSGRIGGRD